MERIADSLIENYPLKGFNTFGLDSTAKAGLKLVKTGQLEELPDLIGKYNRFLILGGGSNVLLPDFYDGLVIRVALEKLNFRDSNGDVLVNAGGGMNWHELVRICVDKGYGGLENLALIPGNVGAAPIQNIGAYGVELKDVFVCLNAFDLQKAEFRCFNRDQMNFGYRDSIFKREFRDRFIITEVWLRLTKKEHHINTSYRALENFLGETGTSNPDIRAVYEAVVKIRRSKLPDPSKIGNAGSFFKNPVVTAKTVENLLRKYPDLVFFPVDKEKELFKIPAGWLIEKCGFKGQFNDQVGCYEKQALVLVNKGGAKAADIVAHAGKIQQTVHGEFGIKLEPEVNIIQPNLYGNTIELSSGT